MASKTTFFSYSRDDSDFVLKLAKDLRKAGAKIWLDQLDITPGSRWDASIESALNTASNMIVVLSTSSVASHNVMDEVSFALESNKNVIPVLLNECNTPFRLRRLQRIDFTTDYNQGLNLLLEVLGFDSDDENETDTNQIQENTENENRLSESKGNIEIEKKQQQVFSSNPQTQTQSVEKKGIPKKYFMIGGVVLLALFILIRIFNSDKPADTNTITRNNQELSLATAFFKQQKYDSAVSIYLIYSETLNAEEQYNLGYMYDEGYGVPADDAEAVKWYRKSAEQGYDWAQISLGDMYKNGTGVTQDYTEAIKWYQTSADQGNSYAQNSLGDMYHEGLGVAADDSVAVNWYQKSAEQGYALAQYNLGYMYEMGAGVPKDLAEALVWYRKAAEQGNADAQNKVNELQ